MNIRKEKKNNRSIYAFTESGKELLNVLVLERDVDYLLDVLKMIKQNNANNTNIVVSAHKVLNRDGVNIRYETKDLLVEDSDNS